MLAQLNVAGNDIGDAGARSLAVMLRSNRTLTSLNCELNSIGVCSLLVLCCNVDDAVCVFLPFVALALRACFL